MKRYILLYILYSLLFVVSGCKPKAELPSQFVEADAEAQIYPDYKDIIVPPNIAPLNFIVRDSAAQPLSRSCRVGDRKSSPQHPRTVS